MLFAIFPAISVAAYLKITMTIEERNRPIAAKIDTDYCTPFLNTISGTLIKVLKIYKEDVQVLHGFDSMHISHQFPLSKRCIGQLATFVMWGARG